MKKFNKLFLSIVSIAVLGAVAVGANANSDVVAKGDAIVANAQTKSGNIVNGREYVFNLGSYHEAGATFYANFFLDKDHVDLTGPKYDLTQIKDQYYTVVAPAEGTFNAMQVTKVLNELESVVYGVLEPNNPYYNLIDLSEFLGYSSVAKLYTPERTLENRHLYTNVYTDFSGTGKNLAKFIPVLHTEARDYTPIKHVTTNEDGSEHAFYNFVAAKKDVNHYAARLYLYEYLAEGLPYYYTSYREITTNQIWHEDHANTIYTLNASGQFTCRTFVKNTLTLSPDFARFIMEGVDVCSPDSTNGANAIKTIADTFDFAYNEQVLKDTDIVDHNGRGEAANPSGTKTIKCYDKYLEAVARADAGVATSNRAFTNQETAGFIIGIAATLSVAGLVFIIVKKRKAIKR